MFNRLETYLQVLILHCVYLGSFFCIKLTNKYSTLSLDSFCYFFQRARVHLRTLYEQKGKNKTYITVFERVKLVLNRFFFTLEKPIQLN